MEAGRYAFQLGRLERARTADGGKAGGGVAISRRYLLAANRSGGTRALQEHERSEAEAAAHDQRQPLGPARRESSVRGFRGDAAGSRALSEGSDPRRHGGVLQAASPEEGPDLQRLHGSEAPGPRSGCDAL